MRLTIRLRDIAVGLVQTAIRIAPRSAAEWGGAMLGELHHIEGDWAAFTWAAGSAGVLAKHALFSLLIPGQSNEIASAEAKENPMRKSTLIGAAICLAASLLFFVEPTFRQAFQISLTQWHALIASLYGGHTYSDQMPDFSKVAEQARKRHDAEGMAFAAIHRWGATDATGLADAAVALDPKLTWIYAFVVNSSRAPSESGISQLEQFDPQNALPYLLAAQRAAGGKYNGAEASNPKWQSAMAAAFASSKVDTYGDRLRELDYTVALRYGLNDPRETGTQYLFDSARAAVSVRSLYPDDYAKVLLDSGDTLEARGNHQGALKQYFLAAHFGEMMQPREGWGMEGFIRRMQADKFLPAPYHHLADFYEKQGDKELSKFFAGLAAKAEQAWQDDAAQASQILVGDGAARWNAQVMGVSGIVMFVCAGMIFLCAIVTLDRSRSIQFSKLRVGWMTRALACGGLAGLLLSSLTLYLSYRPYAEIVRAYLRSGDSSHLLTLTLFFNYLDYQTPPGTGVLYSLWYVPVYFWTGILALSVVALAFAALKFVGRQRAVVAA